MNTIVVTMLIGCVGVALFVYGKRQRRVPHMGFGLILVVYPHFVPGVLLNVAIFVALIGLLAFLVRRGA